MTATPIREEVADQTGGQGSSRTPMGLLTRRVGQTGSKRPKSASLNYAESKPEKTAKPHE